MPRFCAIGVVQDYFLFHVPIIVGCVSSLGPDLPVVGFHHHSVHKLVDIFSLALIEANSFACCIR